MSPSGSLSIVQKNARPPISHAPSISTPFLPPSLSTALINFARAFSAFSASDGSGFLSPPLSPPFLAPSLPFFSALSPPLASFFAAAFAAFFSAFVSFSPPPPCSFGDEGAAAGADAAGAGAGADAEWVELSPLHWEWHVDVRVRAIPH